MSDLKNNPIIRKVAAMPELAPTVYELLEKTDPIRAQIVKECRAIVGE